MTALDYDGAFLHERRKAVPQGHGNSHEHERRNLRLIASPVQQDLHYALGHEGTLSLWKLESRPDSVHSIETIGSRNPQIYRRKHEASTIELFYDLFFVANLAYFTAVHQHVDAPC